MKILIAGSSGLIGQALISYLKKEGNEVIRLVRGNKTEKGSIRWDPDKRELNPQDLQGFDAIVNVAGENIAGRWTASKKKRILESRVNSTSLLADAISQLEKPPAVFINASATGYYGNQGERWLTEASPKGRGFLADVCEQWEAATEAAEKRGIRVVKLRFGVVLSPDGGALGKMLIPFKLGLGGVIGDGKQYVSWIAIDDLVAIVHFTINRESLKGPVNIVAPNPVTNEEWTKDLGKVLYRPTAFPMPALIARLAFGEMADETLLVSTRVKPESLEKEGYVFVHPELEDALRHLLIK